MKKPGNKVKAIYLAWGLVHLALLFSPNEDSEILHWGGRVFYPFTKGKIRNYDFDFIQQVYKPNFYTKNWDVTVYDLSEFTFYMIAPILIYYIITLFKSKDQTPQ